MHVYFYYIRQVSYCYEILSAPALSMKTSLWHLPQSITLHYTISFLLRYNSNIRIEVSVV